MFGLFRKKSPSQPTPVPVPAEAQESPPSSAAKIEARLSEWREATAQIKSDFAAALAQAITECEPLAAAAQTEIMQIDRIWMPVEAKLERATKALSNAWNRPYTVLYKDPTCTAQLAAEDAKYCEEENELALAYEAAYRQVRASAAQSMKEYALEQDGASDAPESGQAFRLFASVAARWIGEWEGLTDWQNMKRAEMRIRRYRKIKEVPMELLHQLHDSARSYWQTALGIEAKFAPHLQSHLERTIEARMKETKKLLGSHWQWREAQELVG
jgi:hypothetical protein